MARIIPLRKKYTDITQTKRGGAGQNNNPSNNPAVAKKKGISIPHDHSNQKDMVVVMTETGRMVSMTREQYEQRG